MLKKLCVFCGSNYGDKPIYKESAVQLAACLANENIELVYGGSNIGLMGTVAQALLKCGGHVTGVVPKGLFPREFALQGNTNYTFVEAPDIHERKKIMEQLSDGFLALPGGVGTFEELFEILSLAQLGLQKKPIAILNINHFYDPAIALLQAAVREGFMPESNCKLFCAGEDVRELIAWCKAYKFPVLGRKWKN